MRNEASKKNLIKPIEDRLTVKEAAEYYGVSAQTIYKAIYQGDLKAHKQGRKNIRIFIDDLKEWGENDCHVIPNKKVTEDIEVPDEVIVGDAVKVNDWLRQFKKDVAARILKRGVDIERVAKVLNIELLVITDELMKEVLRYGYDVLYDHFEVTCEELYIGKDMKDYLKRKMEVWNGWYEINNGPRNDFNGWKLKGHGAFIIKKEEEDK